MLPLARFRANCVGEEVEFGGAIISSKTVGKTQLSVNFPRISECKHSRTWRNEDRRTSVLRYARITPELKSIDSHECNLIAATEARGKLFWTEEMEEEYQNLRQKTVKTKSI